MGRSPAKANVVNAIAIIDNLRASLDHARGGEISKNLAMLYDYMESQLVQANLASDANILDEVSSLLAEVRSWLGVNPDDARRF